MQVQKDDKHNNSSEVFKISRVIEIILSFISITSLLYAFGYLAEKAHMRMLGFIELPIDPERYLIVGGHFVWKSVLNLILLPIKIIQSFNLWILFFAFLFIVSIVFVYLKNKTNINNKIKTFRNVNKNSWVLYSFLILNLFFTVLVLFISLSQFLESTDINSLVTQCGQNNKLTLNSNLTILIKQDQFDALIYYYLKLELILIVFIIAIIISRRFSLWINPDRPLRILLNTFHYILLFMFIIHSILLPINFGILLSQNNFPLITLETTINTFNNEDMLLISQNSNEMALYSPKRNKLFVIQKSKVSSYVIKSERLIFKHE